MNSHLVRTGITLGALVASVGLATSVAAKPGSGCDRMERKLERLDLSSETEAAALAIIDGARPEQRELRAQVREAREALHASLESVPVDETAVMAHADTVAALEQQSKKLRLQTLLEVSAVLSPEQRASFLAKGKRGRNR